MGNNTSSEAPRKPHKLSKPRGNTQASAASLSSSNNFSAPKNGRSSNSYLVGSLPVSPVEQPPNDLAPIGLGVAVPGKQGEGRLPTTRAGSNGDTERQGAGLSFRSSQSDEPVRTLGTTTPTARASNQTLRARSDVQQRFPRPLARAGSMPATSQTGGKRGSVNYDMSSYEVQRLLVTQEVLHEPMAKSQSYTEVREVTESTWKCSHPASTPVSTPVSRANSEASLYMPMRRRSMIQTPGVATRSEQTIERISTRSSFRKSLPSTPSQSRHNSLESIAARRMSMPPVQFDLGSFAPVPTPSEGDYKQLGGMKFGSLRITNGAPELTPGPENENDTQNDPKLGAGASCQGYFEQTKPSSTAAGTEFGKLEDAKLLEVPSRKSAVKPLRPGEDPKPLPKIVDIHPLRPHGKENTKGMLASPPAEPVPSNPLSPAMSKQTVNGGWISKAGCTTTPEYPPCEILEIKDDSNAKANSGVHHSELNEHKTAKTRGSSDSGFVPSPSSETSRTALSKADSGYSSNVSLRSFHSLKRGVTEKAHRVSQKLISEVPERRSSMNLKLKSTQGELLPPPPPPKDNTPPVPTRRSSLSSLAIGTINRIPTLRNSKSRDSSFSKDGTKPSSNRTPADPDRSTSSGTGGNARGKNSQRLNSGSGKKGAPEVQENASSDQRFPAISSRAERRSQRHSKRAPAPSQRHVVRNISSRDTLKTILSVGSTDMLQIGETTEAAKPEQISNTSKPVPPRKRSLHSISHSISQATSNLLLSRKSSSSKIDVRRDVEMNNTQPETILDHGARASSIDGVQHTVGNSAFDQAFTATPVNRGSFSQRKRMLTKMQYMEISSSQSAPLKSQMSAPNIVEIDSWPLSPSIPELSHLRKSKTPPPVSMRTRSLKNLRRPSPDRSQSAPVSEVPPMPRSSFARHSSQESINSLHSARGSVHSHDNSLSLNLETQTRPHRIKVTHGHGKPPSHIRSKSQPTTQPSTLPLGAPVSEEAPAYPNVHAVRPGTAIPYPDSYNKDVSQHSRARSDAPHSSTAWPLSHPVHNQTRKPEVMNHQQQPKSHSPSNSRSHVRQGSSSSAHQPKRSFPSTP